MENESNDYNYGKIFKIFPTIFLSNKDIYLFIYFPLRFQ